MATRFRLVNYCNLPGPSILVVKRHGFLQMFPRVYWQRLVISKFTTNMSDETIPNKKTEDLSCEISRYRLWSLQQALAKTTRSGPWNRRICAACVLHSYLRNARGYWCKAPALAPAGRWWIWSGMFDVYFGTFWHPDICQYWSNISVYLHMSLNIFGGRSKCLTKKSCPDLWL